MQMLFKLHLLKRHTETGYMSYMTQNSKHACVNRFTSMEIRINSHLSAYEETLMIRKNYT